MKALFYIFALLTVDFDKNSNYSHFDSVIYSPANPVEMWPADCQTFNQKEVCGIFNKPYCQPWFCDQTIIFQGTDENGDDFALVIENEDGDEIERVEFAPYEDISGNIFPDFETFTNEGSGNDWNIDATPSVSINGIGSSKEMTKVIALSAGKYRLSYSVSYSTNMSCLLRFYKDGVLVESLTIVSPFVSSPVTDTVEFELSEDVDSMEFEALRGAPASGSVNLGTFELVLLTYTYFTSVVPSELGICESKVKFKIVNTTESPEVVEYHSDPQDISDDHECVNQVEYSNNKNFAGLVYQQVSPVPTFNILIPSVFFHERHPSEQFSIELTSGFERLSGMVKTQRLFETDYLPYYMHRKIQLILMHQSILIDGYYWTQEEGYNQNEGTENKRWPVKTANVYLTQRDFIQRATL